MVITLKTCHGLETFLWIDNALMCLEDLRDVLRDEQVGMLWHEMLAQEMHKQRLERLVLNL